jgi:hypothetical protein
MRMPYGTAGRLRPAGPGNGDDGAKQATRCLEVWEWEGGACGESVDTALDPHATLYEYLPPGRRGGAVVPWNFLTAAGRAFRPHWAGFLALGAGLLTVGLLARPR